LWLSSSYLFSCRNTMFEITGEILVSSKILPVLINSRAMG
jgi:hypothetical protein